MSENFGRVSQVLGPVIDVNFEGGQTITASAVDAEITAELKGTALLLTPSTAKHNTSTTRRCWAGEVSGLNP